MPSCSCQVAVWSCLGHRNKATSPDRWGSGIARGSSRCHAASEVARQPLSPAVSDQSGRVQFEAHR